MKIIKLDYKKEFNIITVFVLLITVITFGMLTGCDIKDNLIESDKVTVFYEKNDSTVIKAIIEFKNQYPDIEVIENTYDMGDIFSPDFYERRDEIYYKFSTEIMAGEGPDLILSNHNMLKNLSKILDSGIFMDLAPVIQKDKDFDTSVFNKLVFESGMYKGKLLYIPLSYSIPGMIVTSEKVFDENEFDLNNGSKFKSQIKELIEREKYKHVFLSLILIKLTDFVYMNGIDFIDYEKKDIYIDKELLEYYKFIHNHLPKGSDTQELKYGGYSLFEKDDLLFFRNYNALSDISFDNSIITEITGNEITLFKFPTQKTIAVTRDFAAINNNSKNKQNAYNFLKILLSKDFQVSRGRAYIPVNNKALDEVLDGERNLRKIGSSYLGLTYTSKNLPESILTEYKKISQSVDVCRFIDLNVYNIIEETLQYYLDGTYSAEEVIQEIENKVTLYLNE